MILPAASLAEKDGTFTNTERMVQRVRRAFAPPGGARPEWKIFCDLSLRLGYLLATFLPAHPARAFYTNAQEIMEEIATLVPPYRGISYERLEKGGLQWPCPSPDHPGTPYLYKDRFPRGKGRFHAVEFREPEELPDGEFPFILTTGRNLWHYHSHTMTGRVPGLAEVSPVAYVEVNPGDAAALGILDGGKVRVISRRGSIVVLARVMERVPRGTVFVPFHFGKQPANLLTQAALDPLAQIPEFKVCTVRLEPLGG